jgi:hypothetical protein
MTNAKSSVISRFKPWFTEGKRVGIHVLRFACAERGGNQADSKE